MGRYLSSLIIFLVGIIILIFTCGGLPSFYLDFGSFMIIGLFPFVFLGILFGYKKMFLSFSVPLKKEPEKDKLIKSLTFFKIYGKTLFVLGFIVTLIEIIAMLIALEDRSGLGSNLAFIFNTLLYCGIINMVIVIPYIIIIKKHLEE